MPSTSSPKWLYESFYLHTYKTDENINGTQNGKQTFHRTIRDRHSKFEFSEIMFNKSFLMFHAQEVISF